MTGGICKEKGSSFRVLVVDDESLLRYSVRKALLRSGVLVDTAENGLQAKQKMLSSDFDLVITDLNMPEMNGVELLGWMKENRPHVEGIVMTGYTLEDLGGGELAAEVVDYLMKPFPMARLQEAVRKSMERLAVTPRGEPEDKGSATGE